MKTNVRNIEAQAEQEAAAVSQEVVCRIADGFERITMTGKQGFLSWPEFEEQADQLAGVMESLAPGLTGRGYELLEKRVDAVLFDRRRRRPGRPDRRVERIMLTRRNYTGLRLWGCAAARGGYLLLTRQLTKPRMVAGLYALSVALGCAKAVPWRDYDLTAAERDEVRRLVRKEPNRVQ